MYALFAAPPDRDLDWQEDGVAGVSRFWGGCGGWSLSTPLHGLAFWTRAQAHRSKSAVEQKLLRKLHNHAKITLDFEWRWHFNTWLAAVRWSW